MCNHASPSVLWLCWNKGFSVLFVSSQAKLTFGATNDLEIVYKLSWSHPSLARIVRSSSSSIYIIHTHYYVHCTRHTGCNNPPESTQYYLLLQLAASKTQGGDDGVFYYNHNHKYMYAYILMQSVGGTTYTRGEQICINGKNGVVVSTHVVG